MKRALILSAMALMACGSDATSPVGAASGETSGSPSSNSGSLSGAPGENTSGSTSGVLGNSGSGSGAGNSGSSSGGGNSGSSSGGGNSGSTETTSGSGSGSSGGSTSSGSATGGSGSGTSLDSGIDATTGVGNNTGDSGAEAATTSPDSGTTTAGGTTAVWTNRYDNYRTGTTMNETMLTPATVAGGKFGLLFSLPVDGTVQTQTLYVPSVKIGGAVHNVAVVTTENDSVYAYDADKAGAALWHTSLGTPFTTASADGTQNMVFGCADIFPVIGINSTPVIDTTTNTLYVLAKTQDTSGNAHQTIHAIDLTTGTDKMPGVEIVASVPAGTGASGATGTTLAFDPKNELPRPALLLYNGTIYIAWAGHCDVTPWHGWVIAYDAATLTQKGAYATTPNGNAGGIWQSGIGLSADDTGVYFVSGNGTFDANGANGNAMNKGLSVGRLTLSATGLTQVDSYTPSTATNLDTNDEDLTTGAIIGPNNNYLYMAGKDSTLRVLNRANLGGFNAAGDKVVQEFGLGGGHVHGGPTFFNGPTPTLFTWCEGCNLSGYTVMAGGMLNTTAATGNIGYQPVHPGAIVTVSSNGQTPNTGVVWASTLTKAASSTGYDAAWHHIVAGELYAFDASNLGKGPIWNSEANAADSLGLFGKFSTPTVANGKVYLGTSTTTNAVRVYGLKP